MFNVEILDFYLLIIEFFSEKSIIMWCHVQEIFLQEIAPELF